MKQRQLGRGGPEVSELGLGCMGMSYAYGAIDDVESARTLNRALDLGVTLIDSADLYGLGHNEKLIGRTLGGRRDDFFLATKFGYRVPEGSSTADTATYIDSSPAWLREACDASLARLGFDTIDLYYMHRRSPDVPIEDTVGAMAELVDAGKVRYLGLSEVSAQTLRAAHAVHPISALQVEYSLFTRDIENELLDTCRELGVAVVAYSPMGRGLLTGAVTPQTLASQPTDFRNTGEGNTNAGARFPRFEGENLEANLVLVDAVSRVAREIGVTPAQAALAWLLGQDPLVIPIPGTKRVRYLEENTAAAQVQLSKAQLDAIEAAIPTDAIAGARYTSVGMRLVDQ